MPYCAAIQPRARYRKAVAFLARVTKNRDCRKPKPAPLHTMMSSLRPRSPCRASRQMGVYVPAGFEREFRFGEPQILIRQYVILHFVFAGLSFSTS